MRLRTITGFAALALAAVGCADTDKPPQLTEQPGTNAFVTRVIDEDTIKVRLQGDIIGSRVPRQPDVRLIGIDTPETVAPNEPVMSAPPGSGTPPCHPRSFAPADEPVGMPSRAAERGRWPRNARVEYAPGVAQVDAWRMREGGGIATSIGFAVFFFWKTGI